MAFAGIWESWQGHDAEIRSCSILTKEADGNLMPIHHRMPVILSSQEQASWLDSGIHGEEALQKLLKVGSEISLDVYEVDRRVNSTKNGGPECWDRLDATSG